MDLFGGDPIGEVACPTRFQESERRKRLLLMLLRGHSFKWKKHTMKDYREPYFVWLSDDFSKLYYMRGDVKGKIKNAKFTVMDDVTKAYAGPPIKAKSRDRRRWEKEGNACFSIPTSTKYRCLDLEARDALLSIRKRNRDMWVEAVNMALYVRHYRDRFKDLVDDLIKSKDNYQIYGPMSSRLSATEEESATRGTKKVVLMKIPSSTSSHTQDDGSTNHTSHRNTESIDETVREPARPPSTTRGDDDRGHALRKGPHPSMSLFATEDVVAFASEKMNRTTRGGSVVDQKIGKRLMTRQGTDLSFPILKVNDKVNDIMIYVGVLPKVPEACTHSKRAAAIGLAISKDYDGIDQMKLLHKCVEQFNDVVRNPKSALKGQVNFLTTISGLRQVLQPMIPLLAELVNRTMSREQTKSKTQENLSEYLSLLYSKVIPARDFLKLLAYVSKYRSLDVSNDNSSKRMRSLEKILDLVPGIKRSLEGERRKAKVATNFMFRPPIVGEESHRKDSSSLSSRESANGSKTTAAMSSSHGDIGSRLRAKTSSRGKIVRSTGDVLERVDAETRSNRRNGKTRRHSSVGERTRRSTSPSLEDQQRLHLTPYQVEMRRISRAERLITNIKRIAENLRYLMKQVDIVENSYSTELMQSTAVRLNRPKSGTLKLSDDYNLERYALPGIHLPKAMVKQFYQYWEQNIKNDADNAMSFPRFMLYFPYKTQKEIDVLAETDLNKFKKLCDAKISGGFGKKTVLYYDTPKQRLPYLVSFRARRTSVSDTMNLTCDMIYKGAPLDTKDLRTTVSGRGVGMVVFRRPRPNASGERSSFDDHVKDEQGRDGIYVQEHRIDKVHHSTIFAGGAVDFAGELKAVDGSLIWVSNKSGHYKPGAEACLEFLHFLHQYRIDLSTFEFHVVNKSIESEVLRKICPDVRELSRGGVSYWVVPSGLVLYRALMNTSIWEKGYCEHLRMRFPPSIVQRAWRLGGTWNTWSQALSMLMSKIERDVLNAINAVVLYSYEKIDRDKLKTVLTNLPNRSLRLYAGGSNSILGSSKLTSSDNTFLEWYYETKDGQPSGPHKSEVWYFWIRRDKLKSHVRISCCNDGPYFSIGDVGVELVKLLALRDIILKKKKKESDE